MRSPDHLDDGTSSHRSGKRVAEVDILRGFALLGICVVNAPVLAGTFTRAAHQTDHPVDQVVGWLVTALFTTKFYLIFSFLFGYSFILMMQGAELQRADFTRMHGRRMLVLLIVGLAHAVLLYPGDVLMTYATLSLPLYAVRHWSPRHLLLLAALVLTVVAALFATIAVFAMNNPPPERSPEVYAHAVAAYRGSASDVVGAHLEDLRAAFAGACLYAGHLFAGMLVGMAASKVRLLPQLRQRPTALRKVAAAGLLIGLPGSVLMALCEDGLSGDRFFYLGRAVGIITAPALASAYGCLVLMWTTGHPTGMCGRISDTLAKAGRMALTHYLVQSLVFAFLFTGLGLSLYGRVGVTTVGLSSLLVWLAQLFLSGPYLARFRLGPLERLQRRFTHGSVGVR
ncbi:DUF418 domain-containing protein [Streptomyces sp. NPDC004822]